MQSKDAKLLKGSKTPLGYQQVPVLAPAFTEPDDCYTHSRRPLQRETELPNHRRMLCSEASYIRSQPKYL